MGGGRLAYRLRAGKRATQYDLVVDVFDVTECSEVVTVADQEAAVEEFRGR